VEHFKHAAHLRGIIVGGMLAMLGSAPPLQTAADVASRSGRSTAKVCANLSNSHAENAYLTVEEKMELEMGRWGQSGVHPLGPDFYRYQRQKNHADSRPSSCQKLPARAPGLPVMAA
jgi:hypothetical protein